MKKNVKDVHVYIDYELAIKLDSLAREKKMQISELYNQLLPLALSNNEIIENISGVIKLIDSISKSNNYLIKLSEQIYSDLNLNHRDPKQSDNLNSFKKKYKKGDNKIID